MRHKPNPYQKMLSDEDLNRSEFNDNELAVMAILVGLKSPARPEEFRLYELGAYGSENPALHFLAAHGFIEIRENGAIVPDDSRIRKVLMGYEIPSILTQAHKIGMRGHYRHLFKQ